MAEEKQKKKQDNEKVNEEKIMIVPLRKSYIKTPRYKRVPKAIKALKKFVARHMKVRDRDLKKIKIDKYLNEEMWFRGIKKPPHKIKVKAKKLENGNVIVELAELSEKAKWKKAKEEKLKKEAEKKKEKGEEKKTEEKEKKSEEGEEEKEKATIEAGLKEAGKKAKEVKHEVKAKAGPKRQIRKALKK